MQLNKIHTLTATLHLETGLHIGAGDAEISIGGVDSQVIKNPLTNEPYIPGSSLKGKIRSLLEWRSGEVTTHPLSYKEYTSADEAGQNRVKPILQLFGIAPDDSNKDAQTAIGPSRLSFWDCFLTQEHQHYLQERNQTSVEVKAENVINRISGTAEHPRFIERVPAGTSFEFKLTIKEFKEDQFSNLKNTLLKGLRLLELDSLGGSGSRGYGKVSLKGLKLNGEDISQDFESLDPFTE